MESDNSDVSDEDKISDTDEKVEKSAPLLTVEPFEVVLKGGSPWGFTLKGGVEVRSPIQISEIKPDGKADVSDTLKLGDYVLGVNDVKCVSLTEAVQLIQSAFRTLTLLVWR
ncbi:PDZ and LIM domain protein 3-like [Argopecten irradians]|uniref:PDZ and LIM domain protein 3-like n=1 Tax=Argopecten irradians TaxID=31199 RepID=UPI00371818B5